MDSKDQVFLSYAHEDLTRVRKLYADLRARELNVWFDKENLAIGRWKNQIERAIAKSRFFIICLSRAALRKTGEEPGFQDEELNRAYNIAQEQPGGSFAIIPVRLEECDRGDHRVTGFQQFDLFRDWDGTLDSLAVQLGGKSLSDDESRDERSELEKARQQFRGKAMAFYYARDHENALRVWESIATLYGDDKETLFWKGLNVHDLGRHEEALKLYLQALELTPQSISTLNNIGAALTELGNPGEALAYLEKLLLISPEYPLGLYNKALALHELDRMDEAVACLRAIPQIDREIVDQYRCIGRKFNEVLDRTEYFTAFDLRDFPFKGPDCA